MTKENMGKEKRSSSRIKLKLDTGKRKRKTKYDVFIRIQKSM